jgi:hypothetical protein
MVYFVALLIFIGVDVVADWLLKKAPATTSLADPLAVVIAILAALLYLKAI